MYKYLQMQFYKSGGELWGIMVFSWDVLGNTGRIF